MRWIGMLSLAVMVMMTGCDTLETRRDVPGRISEERAVRVATAACREFPRIWPDVTRVRWVKDGGYWTVDIMDPTHNFGKFYMVDGRSGRIVGVGKLPLGPNRNLPRPYPGEMPGGPIYQGQMVY